jgi:hypothetical protein
MTFELKSEDVDVDEIMRSIRKRIEEKKKGLYSDEEIQEIAEHKLTAVLDAHEFDASFLPDLEAMQDRWDLRFGPATIYASSRSLVGRLLERIRALLRPVQKLFWNPGPMIWAISRQSDINREMNHHYLHVLHNFAVEITKLNLELQDQKSRVLQLQGRLDLLTRREKTLEDMVVFRTDLEDGHREGGGEGSEDAGA